MRFVKVFLPVCVGLLVAAGTVQAATFNASESATVRQDLPTTVCPCGGTPVYNDYADEDYLAGNPASQARTYIKFTGLPASPTSATLNIYLMNGSGTTPFAKKVDSNSWTESTLTWNNKPTTSFASYFAAPSGWVAITIPASWLPAGGGTASLAVFADSTDGLTVGSDESSANHPTLTVNTGTPTTHYVSAAGSDTADGLTTSTPWRTVAKVNTTVIPAGDTVKFRSGDTWTGDSLEVTESGITVGSYGSGARPIITNGDNQACINVTGSDNVVQDIQANSCSALGRSGIRVTGDRNLIQRTYTTHNEAGILVPTGGDDNTFTDNELIANDVMTVNTCGGNDDYGAYSFAVEGGLRADIGGNEIRDASAVSCDYGADGSCLEIYHGSADFHDNLCVDSEAGTETSGVGAGMNVHRNRFVNAIPVVQHADNEFAGVNVPWVFGYNNVIGTDIGWTNQSGIVTVRRNLYTNGLVTGSGATLDNNL